MNYSFKPLKDNVLAKIFDILPDEKSALILPDTAWVKGYVLAVGEGYIMADGSTKPLSVKVGDTILMHKMYIQQSTNIVPRNVYCDPSIKDEDRVYLIRESEIAAILRQ
jgi:co-chaperonin GroES (HSP10)